MSASEKQNNPIEQNNSEKQSIKYPNGDCYVGNVDDNGLPHGYGVMKYARGGETFSIVGVEVSVKEYSGDWLHGNRSGRGKMKYYKNNDGFARYIGEWSDNQPNGTGRFENNSDRCNEFYEGAWKNGLRHGVGTYSRTEKPYPDEVYEGEWVDDRRCGKGMCKYSGTECTIYEGEWLVNKRHGHGIWHFDNGDIIECEWTDNRKNGEGVYAFANGTSFKAQWVNDKLLPESLKVGNDADALVLHISVEHSGFDYNRSAIVLLRAEVGEFTMENVSILQGTKKWRRNQPLITITDISEGRVKYIVPADFAEGESPVYGSIGRGEKAKHGFSLEGTATIYDEEYDYNITGSIVIECR